MTVTNKRLSKAERKAERKEVLKFLACVLLVPMTLFGMIMLTILENASIMRQLKKDGVISRAVVRYSFEDYHSRWTIICDYQVNGGAFARRTKKRGVTDEAKDCYKVGDTLQIIHLKSDPLVYWLILPDIESDMELLREIENKPKTSIKN